MLAVSVTLSPLQNDVGPSAVTDAETELTVTLIVFDCAVQLFAFVINTLNEPVDLAA